MSRTVRVLVVDDSAFMRYIIAKHLEADPNVTVVGTAQDGLDALTKILALTPDVVTLDVEMPRMDGLTTLKRIMVDCPTPVVMLSSATKGGAQTTVQALVHGAVDFVIKPAASTDMRAVVEELLLKIKMAAKSRPVTAAGKYRSNRSMPASIGRPRPFHQGDPVVVIGASIGGPWALRHVLSALPADFPAAVVAVQHMPAGLTQLLAQRLNESCALHVREATNGDSLAQGLVLVAPGDFHLCFGANQRVILDQSPPHHCVRPALDKALESASQHHQAKVIGVILTGIGPDGMEGAGLIKARGGQVIAEDESTAVIYGMPRRVIEAGLADYVLPLSDVANTLVELVNLTYQ